MKTNHFHHFFFSPAVYLLMIIFAVSQLLLGAALLRLAQLIFDLGKPNSSLAYDLRRQHGVWSTDISSQQLNNSTVTVFYSNRHLDDISTNGNCFSPVSFQLASPILTNGRSAASPVPLGPPPPYEERPTSRPQDVQEVFSQSI